MANKKQNALLSSLSNARNRTLVIFLAALLIVGIAFAITRFRSAADDPLSKEASRTGFVPKVRSVPGAKAPEKYVKLQKKENIQKAEEAVKKKTAAIPTIIGAIQDEGVEAPDVQLSTTDPTLQTQGAAGGTSQIQLGQAQAGSFIESGPFKAETQREKRRREMEQRRKEQLQRVEKMRKDQRDRIEHDKAKRQADKDAKAYEATVKKIQKNMSNYAKGAYKDWSTYPTQEYKAGQWATEEYKPKIARLLESASADGKVITTVKDAAGNPQAITISKQTESKKAKSKIIKAGTILFGVIDTAVNTDEPGPVLATIVHGKYKGGKLIGEVSHEARQEKATINFNTMTIPTRDTSFGVKVVAIDANTARTAIASDVNKHYLLRYGTLFASSFMEGYAKAVSEQGSTTTVSPLTGAQTTTKKELSGSEEFFTALGEVGKRWGQQIRPIFNMPYTVTINQGTGLGLLFLSDVDVTPREG